MHRDNKKISKKQNINQDRAQINNYTLNHCKILHHPEKNTKFQSEHSTNHQNEKLTFLFN